MKKCIKYFSIICSILLVSCTKYTNSATTSDNTSNNTNNTTTTTVVAPQIKFFNVMDYGSTDVFLNSSKVTSIAKYYASSYITAKEGSNNIQLAFPNQNSLLNVNPVLANNTKYSCFFYKVGYEWKYNMVRDDLPTTLNNNYAALRVLDFRTEAYYNYINVRLISPGADVIDQKNRNFLDHATYDNYAKFQTVISGSYNIYMYNDTITSSYRKGVGIDSKGIYSIILTTPTGISPVTNAIFYIYPDVVKHN